MMRYFMTISYNGAKYCGWQIQNNGITVEECIEKALSSVLGEEIDVVGAGRTDSGVNAIGFIAHFDSEKTQLLDQTAKVIYKTNAILPEDIVVTDIFPVAEDAHARFDATSRTYTYYVHTHKDPFAKQYSLFYKFPLDIEKMNKAAQYLIGTKEFCCFEKLHSGNNTSICNVKEAYWEKYTPQTGQISEEGYYKFTITANRFLRNMVRAIVGTLLEIGRGKKDEQWIVELIQNKNRTQAGQSVSGHALFLTGITYPYNTANNKDK
ncbi:MAG: tRNA pseudouridine(38-40) synthase TruA [Bacteroidales bacterium]|nr:tRNA pseudouridine(38-40) synthase TruA [Bacteroidales bacterium]